MYTSVDAPESTAASWAPGSPVGDEVRRDRCGTRPCGRPRVIEAWPLAPLAGAPSGVTDTSRVRDARLAVAAEHVPGRPTFPSPGTRLVAAESKAT